MFTALTLDLETRSAVDLKCSSYRRYASHETTGILCIGLQFLEEPSGSVFRPPGVVFKPGDPCPAPVLYALQHGLPVYAHNCPFDKRVWRAQSRILGWPDIPDHLWRDSMAVCSYYALPRRLEHVALALGLSVQKDMTGHHVMKQMAKPKKPTKTQIKAFAAKGIAERDIPLLWNEDPAKLTINAEYCRKDVEVQTELIRTLGHLPPERLKDWQKDQEINERGAPGDILALLATQAIIQTEMQAVNAEMQQITTGITGEAVVSSVQARNKIMTYLNMQGLDMEGLTKDHVANALNRDDLGATAKRVLELRAAAGKSSILKIKAMVDNIDPDGRMRDALVWHKASTGRWAGARWQPQNFPRECMKANEAEEFHRVIREVDDAAGYITPDTGREEFFTTLSRAMRSYIRPEPGKRLLVSDFASIESRVLAWLAGCETMLEAYRRKECVYSQFASRVYGREIKTKGAERQLGKVAVLGLGYGMGEEKFIETCAKTHGVPDMSRTKLVRAWDWRAREEKEVLRTEGKIVVDLYRKTYPEIPKLWATYEQAFIYACENKTQIYVNNVVFGSNGKWAWITLPSGRSIWYAEPQIIMAKNRWNGKQEPKITFMAIGTNNRWSRQSTYGGSITENCTQATAADFLMAAVHRIDSHGDYPVVLSVHDEVVVETDIGRGSLEEFDRLMHVVPDWAFGCPIEAESQEMMRYGK